MQTWLHSQPQPAWIRAAWSAPERHRWESVEGRSDHTKYVWRCYVRFRGEMWRVKIGGGDCSCRNPQTHKNDTRWHIRGLPGMSPNMSAIGGKFPGGREGGFPTWEVSGYGPKTTTSQSRWQPQGVKSSRGITMSTSNQAVDTGGGVSKPKSKKSNATK